MMGEKREMEVMRRQDEALTVNQLLLIGDIDEKDCLKSNYEEGKKLELTISFATIAFCLSLQGEEVPLILIEGLDMFWKETWNHRIPQIMMTLRGRLRGGNNLRLNSVPMADHIESGIPTIRCIIQIFYRICEMDNQ